MPRSFTFLPLVLLLLAGLDPRRAIAGDADLERLRRAEAEAMRLYRRADVRRARSMLRRAVRAARRDGIRGASLAHAYLQLGVVFAEGAHDHARAVRAFRHALDEDPSVRLDDGMRESPDVSAAFRDATSRERRRESAPDAADEEDDDEDDAQAEARPGAPSPGEVAMHAFEQDSSPLARRASTVEADARADDESALPAAHAAEHAHPRWFVELSMGVGFSPLRQGHAPDKLPPASMLEELAESATDARTERVNVAKVERALREEGWSCNARAEGEAVRAEDCKVASRPGISVLEPIFDLALGYHVLPRLSLALSALVQRDHGEGPMAGVVVGLRAEYLLTAPKRSGLQVGALLGFGVGTLQARGRELHHEAPHASNAAPGGIGTTTSLGTKAAYRLNDHLALGVMPLFTIGLPNVLYDVGLTGGAEVAF